MWWPKGNLWEVVLSFHHGGPRDQIQVTRLSGIGLNPQSHLASPRHQICTNTFCHSQWSLSFVFFPPSLNFLALKQKEQRQCFGRVSLVKSKWQRTKKTNAHVIQIVVLNSYILENGCLWNIPEPFLTERSWHTVSRCKDDKVHRPRGNPCWGSFWSLNSPRKSWLCTSPPTAWRATSAARLAGVILEVWLLAPACHIQPARPAVVNQSPSTWKDV